MSSKTLLTTKKTFYYNFFPTKEEEETSNPRKSMSGDPRVMVEIRDIFPPPVADPENPWRIRKTLSRKEIRYSYIVLSWSDTLEHVLRYWTLRLAQSLFLGVKVNVDLWDVTQQVYPPRKYAARFTVVGKDKFALECAGLMKDRNFRVHDEISLYWDVNEYCFQFRLLF